MFGGKYSAEDLEFSAPVRSLNENYSAEDLEYLPIDTSHIPETGTNYESLRMGYTGSKEVLIKPGGVNFGKAGPAHVATALTAEEFGIECPKTWYDKQEDLILMEYKGDLEGFRGAESNYEGIEDALILKVLTGDPDIKNNIGYDGESWVPYDFDRAGCPIDEVWGQLTRLTSREGVDLDRTVLAEEAANLLSDVDIDQFINDLEAVLEDFFPQQLGFNSLDTRTYKYNLQTLKSADRP